VPIHRQLPPLLGLRTSWAKTKLQNLGSGPSPTGLQIDGNSVESVDSFVYLGSLQKSEDNSRSDIKRRISLAASVMSLSRIWRDKILQLSTKIRLYQALVMSVLLYAAETWTLLSCDEKTLEAFYMKCQRQILHIQYTGLSMSQMQKYPLVPAYHLLWTSSEDVVCQYSAT